MNPQKGSFMLNLLRLWILFTISLLIGLIQLVYAQESPLKKPTSVSSAQTVYKQVSKSIFTIFGIAPEGKDKGVALGSAVAIDKNILATNCHVAMAGTYLVVYINDIRKRGELYYYDQRNDLCLVKVPGTIFSPVNIRQSNTVSIGEEVFAVGNPEGFEKTISRGIISNEIKFKNTVILQTDAAISPGSSGGGLFDEDGNLIGITFLKDVEKDATNIGFAIPTELITEAMQQEQPLPTNEQVATQSTSSSTQSKPKQTNNLTETTNPSHEEVSLPNNMSNDTPATLIGYYGKSKIGLFHFYNKCFISITGRYSPVQPTSTALWFPDNPNSLFIFSRVITLDKATKFMNEKNNFQYSPSKSFIFIENKLYPLTIIAINNIKNPVYLFTTKQDQTEVFIRADYFLGQFYHYNDQSDMTTIKFELDGFTEALAAYNKSCK